jgi:hypothetical protein
MTYNFNYPTRWAKGVLIECNECKLKIFKSIDEKLNIDFINKYRETALYFVISTVHHSFQACHKYPLQTKQKVIAVLAKHGQFTKKEIIQLYDKMKYIPEYTEEWEENARKQGYEDDDIADYILSGTEKRTKIPVAEPINFNFPFIPCVTKMECGLCPQKIIEIECPRCKIKVPNIPEFVDSFQNLSCPNCKKDLIKSGIPLHHGDWTGNKPIVRWTGTDYLFTFHQNCPNKKDGKGLMFPIGVWIENARLIIHFKCQSCDYENVLKYQIRSPTFLDSIYTMDGGRNYSQMKKVKYRTYDLLEGNESKTLEFKISFYGLNTVKIPTSKSIKNAKNQIADEIIGFLNSDGGVLLIGIDKNKVIHGIEKDLQYIKSNKKGSLSPEDFLILDFKELLLSRIVDYQKIIPHINLNLENLPTGECVLIIDVESVNFPVFNSDNQLVINTIGAKKYLEGDKATEYIKERFS